MIALAGLFRRLSGGRRTLFAVGPPAALAFGTAIFFAVRAYHGLWLPGFSDESMHLLGGRVLNAGGRLYATFIDAHGPLIFMLAEAYGALFGWETPNGARLIQPGLAVIAVLCVLRSGALQGATQRLWAAAVVLGLLAAVWHLQGLYLLNFYPVAGFLAASGFAACVPRLWLRGDAPAGDAAVMGLCSALLVATAYSFGPSAVLFAASAWLAAARPVRGRLARGFAAGAALGGLGMLGWMLAHGSLAGYAAFHLAFNQVDYAPYSGATVASLWRSLVPSADPARRVQMFAVLLCCLSCVLFSWLCLGSGRRRCIPAVLAGHAGILLLDARGLTLFQDAALLIAAIAVTAVGAAASLSRLPGIARGDKPLRATAASALLGVCIAGVEIVGRHTISTPLGMTWVDMGGLPRITLAQRREGAMEREVRRVVPPGGRILALVYWPDFYWAADRLPVDRFYEYLPWDADYARAPWFGQKRDLCASLLAAPPAVIAFDDWKVWGRYAAADYMPCVIRLLATQYRPWPGDGRLFERK